MNEHQIEEAMEEVRRCVSRLTAAAGSSKNVLPIIYHLNAMLSKAMMIVVMDLTVNGHKDRAREFVLGWSEIWLEDFLSIHAKVCEESRRDPNMATIENIFDSNATLREELLKSIEQEGA